MSDLDDKEQHDENRAQKNGLTYWNEVWLANKIGFHRSIVNRHFQKHILSKTVPTNPQQCVLFPLCGKTVDMKAVLDRKCRVIGIEWAQLGVEAFFEENQIAHHIIENDENNKYRIYQGTDQPVTIYCGDFFSFNQSLPPIDYIWDRGGFVAVDAADQERYRDTLLRLMIPGHTRLYLLAMCYEDPEFKGPPRSVSDTDIAHYFGSSCSIELVEVADTTAEFNFNNKRNLRSIEEHLHLIIRK